MVGLWNAPITVRVFAAPAPALKPRTPPSSQRNKPTRAGFSQYLTPSLEY